ncbi:DUF2273 domain-containing protein [Paenibacillus xylanexedens]|nr:DUF2273 domain-containing protein [Paenibacillus xylanexedens]
MFFGFVYVWMGFWDMLLFGVLVLMGYRLGRVRD